MGIQVLCFSNSVNASIFYNAPAVYSTIKICLNLLIIFKRLTFIMIFSMTLTITKELKFFLNMWPTCLTTVKIGEGGVRSP